MSAHVSRRHQGSYREVCPDEVPFGVHAQNVARGGVPKAPQCITFCRTWRQSKREGGCSSESRWIAMRGEAGNQSSNGGGRAARAVGEPEIAAPASLKRKEEYGGLRPLSEEGNARRRLRGAEKAAAAATAPVVAAAKHLRRQRTGIYWERGALGRCSIQAAAVEEGRLQRMHQEAKALTERSVVARVGDSAKRRSGV